MRHPRHFPFRQDGFALVVTLSLMVLLALLAVGLLGLSAVSLRSARLGADEMTARTNARLALLLAVGELQRLTGPDQRVTADAGILAKDDATPPANHRWVGVWRTDGFKGEPPGTPVIEPETRRGQGYRDRRSAGRARNPATECLGWLVSGPEPEPTAALPEAESVIARGGPQPVRVAKVLVEGHNRGALAWFVADESTKVKLSLADPYAPGQPDAGAPEGPAMNRWLAPQTHDASAFFNDETPAPDDAGAAKLVSRQQLELSPLMASLPQGQRRALLRQYADDFTAHGKSVLADPLHGGLKCDLTAYLEDGPADALGPRRGIADRDPVNPAPGASRLRSGPRFGMLRNWYALRQAVEGRGKDATITARLPHTTPAGRLAIVDPGEQFLKPVVQPVLTEAVYYINHVLDTSGGNTRVVETVYPRVVLWNPFSTRLATEGYVVFFDFSLRLTIRCEYLNRTGAQETSIIMDSISQPRKMLGFFIPPTVFEPGEALTFCAPSRDREFNEANFLANPLSTAVSPGDLGFYTRRWSGFNLGPWVDRNSVVFNYTFNGCVFWNADAANGRTETITLHPARGGGIDGPALMNPNGPPAVRQLSLDNFSRGNNGRWLPVYTKRKIDLLADAAAGFVPPDPLLAYGGRLRFLYETYSNRIHGQPHQEPWYYAPLAHHNPLAPNIHRWPLDNLFGMQYTAVGTVGGSGPHLYSYGPIAQARQWSPWLDTEVTPHRTASGKHRTAVFNDASFATPDATYPVLDLPLPGAALTSLGALQHVPLSPFAWHPAHVIGNSLPSPFVPLTNATSRALRDEQTLWADKLAQFSSTQNHDITGFHRLADQVLLNDLSFEMNQALWDRYFLSAVPRDGFAGRRWDLARPLPNHRISINPALSNRGDRAILADFHRAARGLWLDGGFNIHSTRVDAWRSLLRSFREIRVPTLEGAAGNPGEAAFPGHTIALGRPATAAVGSDRDHFWRDFRALSDDEIDALAAAIVAQVRRRAPFIGMADFVNRRLVEGRDRERGDFALGGVLQAALDQVAGINDDGTRNRELRLPDERQSVAFQYGAEYWGGPARTPEAQNYKAFSLPSGRLPRLKGSGAASQITQADLLQQLAPVLVARGDTFVVRGYGEARDAAGGITARAWCEAVVQRTPEPVTPDPATGGLDPRIEPDRPDWGRRYVIESFRWLSADEI